MSAQHTVWAQILHWNGATWTRQYLSPGPVLSGVAAVSARDAWTVGRAWKLVSSPNPPVQLNALLGANAVACRDAWAVGSINWESALILHWNGKARKIWKIASTTKPARTGPTGPRNRCPRLLAGQWSGAGSNRRPSAFQADARTN